MPSLITAVFPNWLWHQSRKEKVIYLTFDDGPSPGITEWVLETLQKHHAKATFFCIGDKVQRHPETLLRVQAAGHSIGNHTHNHLNLWKTPLKKYLENTAQCQAALEKVLNKPVHLFRPPYGKMTPRAARRLRRQYQIVMWDVIGGDFQQGYGADRVAGNIIRHAKEGSIVVFHDSEKAQANMKPALEKVLTHFAAKGYKFKSL